MRFGLKIVATGALCLSATLAMANVDWRVRPLPGKGNFEVIEGPRPSNRRAWCEGAKYAQYVLGASGSTRMYILNPYGRPQTQSGGYGIGFTINPSNEVLDQASKSGAANSYSISMKKIGYNMSVGHAIGFCGPLLHLNT